jgi:hypothetical protein
LPAGDGDREPARATAACSDESIAEVDACSQTGKAEPPGLAAAADETPGGGGEMAAVPLGAAAPRWVDGLERPATDDSIDLELDAKAGLRPARRRPQLERLAGDRLRGNALVGIVAVGVAEPERPVADHAAVTGGATMPSSMARLR